VKRLCILGVSLLALVQAQSAPPLRLAFSVPLPGVEGRIDHLALDQARQRVFIAALGNDSLEVVDLKAKTARSLKGFSEPQGVVLIPDARQIFVTNGGDGTGVFVNADSLEIQRRIQVGSDADNVRFDGKRLFVGYGAALAVLDAQGTRLMNIPLAAHPESLQLEPGKDGATSRVYINVPGANHVAVIDLEKRAVVTTWAVPAASNFPMALDQAHHRVLVATRTPARLIAFDTITGKVTTNLETVGDADDVFVDGSRVYVSGGAGELRVLEQRNTDQFAEIARVPTAPGARTALLEPNGKRLFVTVPRRGNQPAQIMVFEIAP
jgi:DNA-binding beta-propeller fold protein YncE